MEMRLPLKTVTLARSESFYTDSDGLPYSDYDPAIARDLLRQEKFDDYSF